MSAFPIGNPSSKLCLLVLWVLKTCPMIPRGHHGLRWHYEPLSLNQCQHLSRIRRDGYHVGRAFRIHEQPTMPLRRRETSADVAGCQSRLLAPCRHSRAAQLGGNTSPETIENCEDQGRRVHRAAQLGGNKSPETMEYCEDHYRRVQQVVPTSLCTIS